MGTRYLIDTNAVIDYLENSLPVNSIDLIDQIEIIISVVSRIELLAYPKASIQYLTMLDGFIGVSTVLNLNEAIILKTIEIRRNHRLKLPDAIIAATALSNNLTLLTRNLSDFKKVTGLKVANPHEL